MLKIILASASPRRSELLKLIGLDFEIIPANIKEEFEGNMDAGKYASEMSRQKAMAVAKEVKGKYNKDTYVLGADTVVVIDNIILGKPVDENHAFGMLNFWKIVAWCNYRTDSG